MDNEIALAIKQSIGYLNGQLGALIKANKDDHDELKSSIKDIRTSTEKSEINFAILEKVIASHDMILKSHDTRICDVERKQEYVSSIGRFMSSHPKLILFGLCIIILGLFGWGADQIIALVKNL
jgi:hypothetical protein